MYSPHKYDISFHIKLHVFTMKFSRLLASLSFSYNPKESHLYISYKKHLKGVVLKCPLTEVKLSNALRRKCIKFRCMIIEIKIIGHFVYGSLSEISQFLITVQFAQIADFIWLRLLKTLLSIVILQILFSNLI